MLKNWKSSQLVQLIRLRYPHDGFVVMEQVPNWTDGRCSSWIDVVVVNTWPTRGFVRRAFEIKVSRSDFRSEIRSLVKNAWVAERFHEFWYVAPQDVIKTEELPPHVGWLKPSARGNSLQVVVPAFKNPNPVLDNLLLATLCRAASKRSVPEIPRSFRRSKYRTFRLKGDFNGTLD
jgi:hypothetical protein